MFKTPAGSGGQTEGMTIREFFPEAAREVVGVVRGARTDDLSAATPCADFDLKALVNHFIGTTGALTQVGLRKPLDADDPYGSRREPSQGDWSTELASHAEALAEAWSDPTSWDGSVDMGDTEMPATVIGEMAFAELLLHGWDLARATGQQLTIPDEVALDLRHSIEETAELGRKMGAYGDEVSVPDQSTQFERALGASGRDPNWTTS